MTSLASRLLWTATAPPLLLFAALSASAAQTTETGGFSCPAIEPMPRTMAIRSRYISGAADPTYSVLDEAKVAQQKPERRKFDAPVTRINAMSIMYGTAQTDARRNAIAECLGRHFAALPTANAMEGAQSPEDHLYRDWMVASLAVSYLRLQSVLDAQPEADAVHAWFGRQARQSQAFYEGAGGRNGLNNHIYWGAATVAAVGKLNADAAASDYARGVLEAALTQVDADGILAKEIGRGRRARHYHAFSVIPLAAIALLTDSDPEAIGDGGFDRLAARIASDFEDPAGGLIAQRAGPQEPARNLGQLSIVTPLLKADPALAERYRKLTEGERATNYFLGGDYAYLVGLAAPPGDAPVDDAETEAEEPAQR